MCLTFDWARRHFSGRGEPVALHSLDCNFNSGSKSPIHISSITTIRRKNAWSSTSNLSFSKVAMSRRFWFCSALKQWGTHRAEIFLFFKSLAKIRNTDAAQLPDCRKFFTCCTTIFQEHLPQASHFFYLLKFSAFLILEVTSKKTIHHVPANT